MAVIHQMVELEEQEVPRETMAQQGLHRELAVAVAVGAMVVVLPVLQDV